MDPIFPVGRTLTDRKIVLKFFVCRGLLLALTHAIHEIHDPRREGNKKIIEDDGSSSNSTLDKSPSTRSLRNRIKWRLRGGIGSIRVDFWTVGVL